MTYNRKQLYFETLDYLWDRAYNKKDVLLHFENIDGGWEIPGIEICIYDHLDNLIGKVELYFEDIHCLVDDRSKEILATTFDEIKSVIDSIKEED